LDPLTRKRFWLGLSTWVEKHRSALVIVGCLIAGISNHFHNNIEDRTGAKSALAAAMSEYRRDTSLFLLAATDDKTALTDVEAEKVPLGIKLVKKLPSVNRYNSEANFQLNALLDFADHVEGIDQEKKEAWRLLAISTRLQGLYKSIAVRLEGHFDHVPTDPQQAKDIELMAQSYIKAYQIVGTGFLSMDASISQKAKLQYQNQESASALESKVWRWLTWMGLALPLFSIIKPPQNNARIT
jgi:hypothetical protein